MYRTLAEKDFDQSTSTGLRKRLSVPQVLALHDTAPGLTQREGALALPLTVLSLRFDLGEHETALLIALNTLCRSIHRRVSIIP